MLTEKVGSLKKNQQLLRLMMMPLPEEQIRTFKLRMMPSTL